MMRIAKAAAMTAVAGATVLGAAGAATASDHGRGYDHGGASAQAAAVGSPGVASGNVIQIPVSVPINLCGNTINIVGLLNPAAGNVCVNA
ncbi:chaplin [Actinacidiphila glaucinigra]|uniref:chaplin n=1 Tax=Actinacidiphila glaucinigra TaxID=235986 RepID=UPI0029B312AA|nr:chaplin [Streptomyces sp. PA03-3a]